MEAPPTTAGRGRRGADATVAFRSPTLAANQAAIEVNQSKLWRGHFTRYSGQPIQTRASRNQSITPCLADEFARPYPHGWLMNLQQESSHRVIEVGEAHTDDEAVR